MPPRRSTRAKRTSATAGGSDGSGETTSKRVTRTSSRRAAIASTTSDVDVAGDASAGGRVAAKTVYEEDTETEIDDRSSDEEDAEGGAVSATKEAKTKAKGKGKAAGTGRGKTVKKGKGTASAVSAADDEDDEDEDGAALTTVVLWQWKSGARWVAYNKEDTELLEEGFQDDLDEVETCDLSFARGVKYHFDYKALTQTNTKTRKVRSIRRAALTKSSSESDTGYAKLIRKSSATWTDDTGRKKGTAAKAATRSGKKKQQDQQQDKKYTGHVASLPPKMALRDIKFQAALGAQSKRNETRGYGAAVNGNAHAKQCFDKMLENEARLCGEWACFYSSYSLAALLFEVQAAVAAVLFRFKSVFAPLPRLLKKPFDTMGDAQELMANFPKMKGRDHDPRFRAVAICATTSLVGPDPEAPPRDVFLAGYSCSDVKFMDILKELLKSCHVPVKKVTKLAKDIIKASEKAGLDVSQFGGKGCRSGRQGHMLQIFMKRHIVDQFVYAAHPFGVIDKKRMPISETINGRGPINGQVRICAHPTIFMRANLVRMFLYSADETFHQNRVQFQHDLTELLEPILGSDDTREAAARGIHGGTLPDWYDSADQRDHAKHAATSKSYL
eukprot:m.57750 g.57750  ORF g.57750 m.57750 type:complete len:614 (-) comp11627_c0_seq3:257-2098(-)